jgi:hypothetical protein
MSKLGTGIDELEIDDLEVLPGGMVLQTLSENQSTLLDSDTSTLDHDPILVDLTVVGESSHGSNTLLSKVSSGTARTSIATLSNSVNLLVELGTMEVSILTSTGNSGGNTGRMP